MCCWKNRRKHRKTRTRPLLVRHRARVPSRTLPCPVSSSWQRHRQRQREQLTQAKASAMPEESVRILERQVPPEEIAMKQAQPLGQKMEQARARFRWAIESKKKAQETFEASATRGGTKLRRTWTSSRKEAPLPIMPVPQVYVSLVTNLGSFDKHHRQHVEPRRRAATRSPDTGYPKVEQSFRHLRLFCLKREAQH